MCHGTGIDMLEVPLVQWLGLATSCDDGNEALGHFWNIMGWLMTRPVAKLSKIVPCCCFWPER